ncbi:hypothetical protein C8Q70DRAFT_195594 [Cubamyces menziesii]|uniref:Uncharacterized protein n=1 Tax=Trametes cubensis TaxID=1111947 RepID=A0AAD7XDC3_9APHY|nr:hypothetical protein C8Q70DRAFT_195594 [Cubamyces menziesii]KAJ8487592.1 hypothetical protein ONZ51_g4086 [Trametes cubensis]
MAQATKLLDDRLQLVVAQQDLQGHHRRTEHWALVIVSPKSRTADVLQLAGNMDTFHFEALRVSDVLKLGDLCGGCRVGDIAADSVDKLRDRLASHRIILHDKMWDCQDWLLEAIRDLKDEAGGWVQIDSWFTERGLREKLREERELWERADDHFFERLYAQA